MGVVLNIKTVKVNAHSRRKMYGNLLGNQCITGGWGGEKQPNK